MKFRCSIAIAALLFAAIASAKEIPDAAVVDQDGRPLHFYRDLVAQKVVVVAFFFTRCVDACPTIADTLSHLQDALGDRLGRDVSLVSVSLDPENDSPANLAAWAKGRGVKPGWTLVTGRQRDLTRIARAFTGDPAKPGLHSVIVYLGNDRTGEWIRDSGSQSTEHYLDMLAKLGRAR
ncbi:MAG TPA: SCO family protein [Thermoanaerobaculia bacterium]|jgi:protein SCO1/2|nr:SCO family protein [Thermoanaerobaculia bacterium]